jgi:hypothetical protein
MKKHLSKTMMYTAIATFLMVTVSVSYNNIAFAFIGFGFDDGDQSQGSTQSSLQASRCYSPHGSIIDSCNSGGFSATNDTGINALGQ